MAQHGMAVLPSALLLSRQDRAGESELQPRLGQVGRVTGHQSGSRAMSIHSGNFLAVVRRKFAATGTARQAQQCMLIRDHLERVQ